MNLFREIICPFFSYSIVQAILGGVMVAVGYNYVWEHHNGGNVDGVSTEE